MIRKVWMCYHVCDQIDPQEFLADLHDRTQALFTWGQVEAVPGKGRTLRFYQVYPIAVSSSKILRRVPTAYCKGVSSTSFLRVVTYPVGERLVGPWEFGELPARVGERMRSRTWYLRYSLKDFTMEHLFEYLKKKRDIGVLIVARDDTDDPHGVKVFIQLLSYFDSCNIDYWDFAFIHPELQRGLAAETFLMAMSTERLTFVSPLYSEALAGPRTSRLINLLLPK